MRVLVIGAGVVGVTTAWYLLRDGHQVTVAEAASGPAQGASFGNAGGVCPGFAGPWAAPGMPLKALRWMFQPSAPLKLRPRLDPAQWRWLAAFLRNCTAARFAENKARMQRLAHYSKRCLVALREELGLEYDTTTLGVLQVFATPDELAGASVRPRCWSAWASRTGCWMPGGSVGSSPRWPARRRHCRADCT